MLNSNTLGAVIGLGDKLAKKNLILAPKEGTPLATLCSAGYLPNPDSGDLGLTGEDRILMGSVAKNLQGICEHDMVMDEIVEVVKKTVAWNLDVARNQVNPSVLAGVEDIRTYVDNAQSLNAGMISVHQHMYHSIWSSRYLSGMVDRYTETPVGDVKLSFVVPMVAVATDFELVDTGVSRFNDELNSFLAALPAGFVREVYSKIFESSEENLNSSLLSHLNTLYVAPDQLLVIHLLALRLLDNAPNGVRATSNQYREFIAAIIAQSGRALCRQITRRESDAANKVLVTNWSRFRADDIGINPVQITVNADVYNKWLEQGGSPEVLFGSFVNDRNGNYESLLERKEMYLSVWQRQERVITTNLRLQKANNMLTGLVRAIEKQIADTPDEFLLTERKIYVTNLHAYVRHMPNNWHEEDLYTTVRKTVCNILYPHTEAFDILNAIDAASRDNPEISIREAGLLAVTEIVSIWVAKLIKVDQNNL